jgi:WD40 repeat protein
MTRAWPMLVLTVLLGWQSNAAFGQKLQVKEKSSVKLNPKVELGLSGWISSYSFSPDGKMLAIWLSSGVGNTLAFFDATTGDKVAAKDVGRETLIGAMAFNSNGTLLAVGTTNGDNATVTIWDLKTRKQSAILRLSATLRLHEVAPFFSLAFSPDGKTLATPATRGVSLWEVHTGKERAVLPADWLERIRSGSLAYSPDGKLLYAGFWHAETLFQSTVWNMETEEEWVPPKPLAELDLGLRHIVFSRDANVMATIGWIPDPPLLKLWDLNAGKAKWEMKWSWSSRRPSDIKTATFSPDGKLFAFQQSDEKQARIELLAAETGNRLATVETLVTDDRRIPFGDRGDRPFVFSRDGKTLTALVRTDKEATIKVWELTWEKEPGK